MLQGKQSNAGLVLINRYQRTPINIGSYLQGFSCFDEAYFAPLGEDSGIPQRLHNIIAFKVGIIREQFLYAHSLANLTDDHADCNPHTANTGLAPHNKGILGYPVKVFFVHKKRILRKQAKNKIEKLTVTI